MSVLFSFLFSFICEKKKVVCSLGLFLFLSLSCFFKQCQKERGRFTPLQRHGKKKEKKIAKFFLDIGEEKDKGRGGGRKGEVDYPSMGVHESGWSAKGGVSGASRGIGGPRLMTHWRRFINSIDMCATGHGTVGGGCAVVATGAPS